MDRGSIGCIIPSKEENSSFILKQRCQLQLQLRSAGLAAPPRRAAFLEHWALKTLLNTFRLELFWHIHALQQPVSHRCAHIHTETHKYGCTQVVLQGNTATCERAVVCRRGGCLGEWFEFSITSNCRKRRKVNSLHFTSQIVLLYLCIMHAHINP